MQQMRNKAGENSRLAGFVLCLARRLDSGPALLAIFQMRLNLLAYIGRERTPDIVRCDDMTGRHSASPESRTVTSSSISAALGRETNPFRVLITDLTVPMLIN